MAENAAGCSWFAGEAMNKMHENMMQWVNMPSAEGLHAQMSGILAVLH